MRALACAADLVLAIAQNANGGFTAVIWEITGNDVTKSTVDISKHDAARLLGTDVRCAARRDLEIHRAHTVTRASSRWRVHVGRRCSTACSRFDSARDRRAIERFANGRFGEIARISC